jgi:hypothetical protein
VAGWWDWWLPSPSEFRQATTEVNLRNPRENNAYTNGKLLRAVWISPPRAVGVLTSVRGRIYTASIPCLASILRQGLGIHIQDEIDAATWSLARPWRGTSRDTVSLRRTAAAGLDTTIVEEAARVDAGLQSHERRANRTGPGGVQQSSCR